MKKKYLFELDNPSVVVNAPRGHCLSKSTTPLSPGRRGGATARSALGWYRPSVGVPRDVGC